MGEYFGLFGKGQKNLFIIIISSTKPIVLALLNSPFEFDNHEHWQHIGIQVAHIELLLKTLDRTCGTYCTRVCGSLAQNKDCKLHL